MAEQPIIRGIQAVGAVSVYYRYNSSDGILPIPLGFSVGTATGIDTSSGISVAGFRLDSEFLNAAQQISSSNVIPILGGGGVALTNNNRTGTITLTCSRVSVPFSSATETTDNLKMGGGSTSGQMGVVGTEAHHDMVFIAQCQQAAKGGDSVGSTIMICYLFNGVRTKVQFEGCTVANIAPIILAGNDAANYSIQINYLNWKLDMGSETDDFITG